MKAGTRLRSSRSCCWSSGRSARVWRAVPRSRAVVSWPAANRLEAIFITSSTGGREPSGKVAVASPVITSSRGSTPPVLDVAGELGVEVLERVVGHLEVAGVHELLEELRVVLLGHAEQVGDDQHGVGLGVLADELALAPGVEPVDLVVGQSPQGLLVLLEALRRDQPHQQPALGGVLGRVERRELIAEGEVVAVGLDDLGDVVALERHGELGEGPDGRVAVRERGLVVVDLHGLVVAGHHVDVVVRLLDDRALAPQVLEVGVGVVDEVLGEEEVDGFELLVAHWCSRVGKGGCPDRMGTDGRVEASRLGDAEYVQWPRRPGGRRRVPGPRPGAGHQWKGIAGHEPGAFGEGRCRHGGAERDRPCHHRAVRPTRGPRSSWPISMSRRARRWPPSWVIRSSSGGPTCPTPTTCRRLVDSATEAFGDCTSWSTTPASPVRSGASSATTSATTTGCMAVNLFGVIVGTQRAGRHMAEHGGGSIINTSSIGGLTGADPPSSTARPRRPSSSSAAWSPSIWPSSVCGSTASPPATSPPASPATTWVPPSRPTSRCRARDATGRGRGRALPGRRPFGPDHGHRAPGGRRDRGRTTRPPGHGQ